MLKLSRYLRYFKKEVIIGPFFKLMEAIFELTVPLVMASIIDNGINKGDKTYVLQRGGLILLLGFVGLIFALICQYSAARASQGFGTKIRDDLFAHINTLSHNELDKLGTNTLITVISNDVNQLQLAVAMLIRLVVRAPFLVIGALVMAMMLDLKLSLIFLIVAPMVSVVLFLIMKLSIPYYKKRQRVVDKVSLVTRENLSGVRVVRAFSKQKREEERFEQVNEEVADIAIRVGKITAFLNPATFAILNTAIIGILWFGGIRVEGGVLTQGEVIAFANYMTQISLALVVVANLVIIFTKATASAARVNRVLETQSTLEEGLDEAPGPLSESLIDERKLSLLAPGARAAEKKRAIEISLDGVSFAYPESGEYALEEISLSIHQGETIGIIGGTGSGKTTLINLLPRFYEVTKGEIRVCGRPIKEYTFEALRGLFGIVPQKAVLFAGTIEDNLRMSWEEASLEDIKKAIEIAQAKEFVERLPNQYDTMISQGGRNLSGGQRQRLTIARALVRKPRILILDDSSSALDYATDASLRQALKEHCSDMTVLMISQRANSIKYADKIIVLDDGKIAGIGTHDKLYNSCDIYRDICQSQQS